MRFDNAPWCRQASFKYLFTFLLLISQACCGGGGNSSTSSTGDFSLAVNPSGASIVAGKSVSVSVSATAVNGFTSAIGIQLAGLPAGVGVSPTTISLTAGTPQQVTISAAASITSSTVTVTFTGTSGSLTHSATLTLSVFGTLSSKPPSRTRYLRTDAVTNYFLWPNSHWAIYNPPTAYFFVTDPQGNEVTVLDSVSETKVATIHVPGAYGIDDTPDHKTLYVGTLIGDVYSIDPVALTVTHRYVASQIGPFGYQAVSVQVLADGRLALLGGLGGIPGVDGSASFAVWDPVTNSISIYASTYGGGELQVPYQPMCGGMGNIGGFAHTTDRKKMIVANIGSDGTLCELDPSTGQSIYVSATGFSTNITTSPDGKYILLPGGPTNQVVVYDASTLQQVAVFNVAGDTSSAGGLTVSADSSTVFVPNDEIVYAYSLTTYQQIGWLPNIYVAPTAGGGAVGPINSPYLQAADSTGLLMGPLEEGVGFIDTSTIRTEAVGSAFTNAYLNPANGPASGGTQAEWSTLSSLNSQSRIYFGSQRAAPPTRTSGLINVTTPPGLPGPVDVYGFAADAGLQIIPEAFSYGPTILEVTPNASVAQGGGTGFIYGYGLGPIDATTVPSDLQVSVGGVATKITGFEMNAYGQFSPPFPLQALAFTIPAGSSLADVTVTNSSGSTTVHNAFSYLPAMRQFPLPNSSLAQGVYDPYRDLYYFTDTSKIQVFSMTQGTWLAPINVPAPSGKTQRLWGIALSQDGSKLAVTDLQADVVYVLNPTNTASVQTIPIVQPFAPSAVLNPAGIAISNQGFAYLTMYVEGGTGYNSFYKLNTLTGVAAAYPVNGPQLASDGYPQDVYLRAAISTDNSRVFFNDDGYIFSVDTATDTIFSGSVGQGCCYGDYDLTLSSNQRGLEASSYLFDSDLNGQASYALNDREVLNTSYIYGTKLSPDGALLFQPSLSGIDVIDGRLGTLLTRIALPLYLSGNYDALVSDGKDNILIAITGGGSDSGIMVLDLTSLAEPSPLSYVHKVLGTPRAMQRAEAPQQAESSQDKSAASGMRIPRVRHVHSATVLEH